MARIKWKGDETAVRLTSDLAAFLILLSQTGLIYGWYFYFARMRKSVFSWRDRSSMTSLVLASLVALFWPLMMVFTPKADWISGVGVAHQVEWVNSCTRLALWALLVSFVVALFGRPRLIAPILIACVGAAVFWIGTTMP